MSRSAQDSSSDISQAKVVQVVLNMVRIDTDARQGYQVILRGVFPHDKEDIPIFVGSMPNVVRAFYDIPMNIPVFFLPDEAGEKPGPLTKKTKDS